MKKEILYKPLGWLVSGASRLPLGVLYVLSDILFALLYYVVRYRRDVVIKNLRESFPDRPEHEIKVISRKFFRNFADYIVETLKVAHISDEEMCRRMKFDNIELIDSYLESGRAVTAYFSHCGNWEWVPSITLHSEAEYNGRKGLFCQIYRPLRNKWFDDLMLHLRSRFGSVSLSKKTAFRHLLGYAREGVLTVTGFMSDQKPSHGDAVHVVEFLHHPTAMITGTEILARKMKTAAVYLDMEKTGRGYYRVTVRRIADNVADTPEMSVTDRYVSLLEATINRQPDIWLWSHKRWKIPVALPQKTDDNNNGK